MRILTQALLIAFAGLVMGMPCMASQAVRLPTGRHYFIDLPPKGGAAAPLIIVFHGGGESARSVANYSGLSAPANARGYAVMYPSGSGRLGLFPTWNAGNCCVYAMLHHIDDVGFTAALIDDAVQRFGINRHRVFLTGISNGAMMSYRVAAERPDLVAGIAPVAGSLITVTINIKGAVPIVDFHGDADHFARYQGGLGRFSNEMLRSVPESLAAWAKANGVSQTPTLTLMPDVANDGTRVERLDYGKGKAPLVHYKILGGGHTWPGATRDVHFLGPTTRNIDADQIMLDFFDAQPSR